MSDQINWIQAKDLSRSDIERTDYCWWWDGESMVPVHVQYGPMKDKLFASSGQLGWNRSQFVEDMGGHWLPILEPQPPEVVE